MCSYVFLRSKFLVLLSKSVLFISKFYCILFSVSHHKPKIAEDQHPTCKTSDMLHSDIVTNGILHRTRANFTFLGSVRSMKECLGLCCMDKKCELAYLVNKTKCLSTQCDDSEKCKIEKNQKKGRSNDVQMSLMVRKDENRKGKIDNFNVLKPIILGNRANDSGKLIM